MQPDPEVVGPGADLAPPPVVEPPPPAPVVPPPGPRLVQPGFTEYVVQQGDRGFEDIAQKVYGDRGLWRAIAKANPLTCYSPDRLIPGRTRLHIALDPTNVQGRVESDPAAPPSGDQPSPTPEPADIEYTIKDDTLWGIAKRFYGRGALWRLIAEANREAIPDPDRPVAGTKIRIPRRPTPRPE